MVYFRSFDMVRRNTRSLMLFTFLLSRAEMVEDICLLGLMTPWKLDYEDLQTHLVISQMIFLLSLILSSSAGIMSPLSLPLKLFLAIFQCHSRYPQKLGNALKMSWLRMMWRHIYVGTCTQNLVAVFTSITSTRFSHISEILQMLETFFKRFEINVFWLTISRSECQAECVLKRPYLKLPIDSMFISPNWSIHTCKIISRRFELV